MEVFIVFWFLFGVVSAVIASARGGSALVGFLVGFVLGPFGVIIAFFLGGERARAEKDLAAGTSKKCPRCAELVKPEARVCRFCGYEFRT